MKSDPTRTTNLFGSPKRKDEKEIIAYGDVDETLAHVSALKSFFVQGSTISKQVGDFIVIAFPYKMLSSVEDDLMFIMSNMHRADGSFEQEMQEKLNSIKAENDTFSPLIESITGFVTFGHSKSASAANVCRTVCRRAERSIIAASINAKVVEYMNFLSTYMFSWAVFLAGIKEKK